MSFLCYITLLIGGICSAELSRMAEETNNDLLAAIYAYIGWLSILYGLLGIIDDGSTALSDNKRGGIDTRSNSSDSVRPEAGLTGSRKHGVNWTEGPARARSTGNPQGQWAESDLEYATNMANSLEPGQSAYFDLPEGSESIVHMPDGSVVNANSIWVRNNGTGTWHGYPLVR